MRIDPNIEIRRHLEQNLTKIVLGTADQAYTREQAEIANLMRAPRGTLDGESLVDRDDGSPVIARFMDEGVAQLRDCAERLAEVGESLDIYLDIVGLELDKDGPMATHLDVEFFSYDGPEMNATSSMFAQERVKIESDESDYIGVLQRTVSASDLANGLGVRVTYIGGSGAVGCVHLFGTESSFRIAATKQFDTDALRRGAKDEPYAERLNDDYQVSFSEWRGRRHMYLPIVESHFVFECYGPSPQKARDLSQLIDLFLHDPASSGMGSVDLGREVCFGRLSVYFCLRARLPELYLELASRVGGLPQFAVTYRLMYSDEDT